MGSVKDTSIVGHRWRVFSRIIAASIGGYVFVSLSHLALAVILPTDRNKALLFSMETGFITWSLIIIWCFSARTATRAWLGLALAALPLLAIDVWWILARGGWS